MLGHNPGVDMRVISNIAVAALLSSTAYVAVVTGFDLSAIFLTSVVSVSAVVGIWALPKTDREVAEVADAGSAAWLICEEWAKKRCS